MPLACSFPPYLDGSGPHATLTLHNAASAPINACSTPDTVIRPVDNTSATLQPLTLTADTQPMDVSATAAATSWAAEREASERPAATRGRSALLDTRLVRVELARLRQPRVSTLTSWTHATLAEQRTEPHGKRGD